MTETEVNEKIEELAGGIDKAFRLLRLWRECRQTTSGSRHGVWSRNTCTTEELFRKRALRQGYSQECVDFYIKH